jgi:hypothetical protein
MRSLYEPVDRKKRAAKYRLDAEACERAGYPGFAGINREMAAFLDPFLEEPMPEGYSEAEDTQIYRRAA